MINYPCPECGFDGPHPVVEDDDPQRHHVQVECANPDCHAEFWAEVV